VRHYYTVNRPVGRDGNIVNDSIDRITQKFETGNKRDVKFAFRESLTQSGWMIELNLPRPAAD
jgi:hypothetical protein